MTLKIIGTGLSRTGTMSLKDALEILTGEPCYHMYELFLHPERLRLWEEAEKQKHTDWDALFSGYGSAVDLPAANYYSQLMDEYPDAKFVHTDRDPSSWYESAVNTIFAPTPPIIKELKLVFESMDSETKRNRLRAVRFASHGIREGLFRGRSTDRNVAIGIYNEHNRNVKATIPPHKLLVFRIEEGWKPLCDFLGFNVPLVDFPHSNKRYSFGASMETVVQMS